MFNTYLLEYSNKDNPHRAAYKYGDTVSRGHAKLKDNIDDDTYDKIQKSASKREDQMHSALNKSGKNHEDVKKTIFKGYMRESNIMVCGSAVKLI